METNQNSIHEKIKSRPNLGNASSQAVQNLLSSHLLPKDVKINPSQAIFCQQAEFFCNNNDDG
jgi:hypothetical protein